jgi:monoamine oxidase
VQNRRDIPKPYAASYRDWEEDPFGGGANFWDLRVDSYDVSEKMLNPVKGVPVYVCGEAYSHDQGWVEGALATADDVLQGHFGLSQPQWLRGEATV